MTEDRTLPKAAQQEPSMEDILASIRRILSDDSTDAAEESERPAPARQKTPIRPQSPIESKPARAVPDTQVQAGEDIELAELGAAVPEPMAPNVLRLTPEMRVTDDRVLSTETAVASTDVLSQLARAILDRRDIALGARDVTLESMVREMLRPLLKEWLDRNLPYLIERLVKSEIDLMVKRAERLDD